MEPDPLSPKLLVQDPVNWRPLDPKVKPLGTRDVSSPDILLSSDDEGMDKTEKQKAKKQAAKTLAYHSAENFQRRLSGNLQPMALGTIGAMPVTGSPVPGRHSISSAQVAGEKRTSISIGGSSFSFNPNSGVNAQSERRRHTKESTSQRHQDETQTISSGGADANSQFSFSFDSGVNAQPMFRRHTKESASTSAAEAGSGSPKNNTKQYPLSCLGSGASPLGSGASPLGAAASPLGSAANNRPTSSCAKAGSAILQQRQSQVAHLIEVPNNEKQGRKNSIGDGRRARQDELASMI